MGSIDSAVSVFHKPTVVNITISLMVLIGGFCNIVSVRAPMLRKVDLGLNAVSLYANNWYNTNSIIFREKLQCK